MINQLNTHKSHFFDSLIIPVGGFCLICKFLLIGAILYETNQNAIKFAKFDKEFKEIYEFANDGTREKELALSKYSEAIEKLIEDIDNNTDLMYLCVSATSMIGNPDENS